MNTCYDHPICTSTYVQTPEDVDTILKCMIARGVLTTGRKGVFRRNNEAKEIGTAGQN